MAKPKRELIVKEIPDNTIHIYCDNPEKVMAEIREIEGVNIVFLTSTLPVNVKIDPRYDLGEIAEEIRELLSAEVPAVFREDD